MATTVIMQHREDSAKVLSPPGSPHTPHTPKTPACSILTPVQQFPPICPSQTLTPQTVSRKRCAPRLGTYNAYIPPGFKHHHVPSDISQGKRSHLNYLAHQTQSDVMRFYRIVEWDGTWMSTLSLPPLECFTNVAYFETTFPDNYSVAEGLSRLQQVWIEGSEPDYGVAIDVFDTLDSACLLVEDFFDYESYYGESGNPNMTVAEKSDWQSQSQQLESSVSCTSIEALLRVESEHQTSWLNQ